MQKECPEKEDQKVSEKHEVASDSSGYFFFYNIVFALLVILSFNLNSLFNDIGLAYFAI